MVTPRSWSFVGLIASWLLLVSSAAVVSVPYYSFISLVLVPAAAVGLVFSVVSIQSSLATSPRRRLGGLVSGAATLFVAGLATYCAMGASWWLLDREREIHSGGAEGFWLLMAGLNVLGALVLAVGNELRLSRERRTNFLLTLAVGSAPIVTLLCVWVVSQWLPFSD